MRGLRSLKFLVEVILRRSSYAGQIVVCQIVNAIKGVYSIPTLALCPRGSLDELLHLHLVAFQSTSCFSIHLQCLLFASTVFFSSLVFSFGCQWLLCFCDALVSTTSLLVWYRYPRMSFNLLDVEARQCLFVRRPSEDAS